MDDVFFLCFFTFTVMKRTFTQPANTPATLQRASGCRGPGSLFVLRFLPCQPKLSHWDGGGGGGLLVFVGRRRRLRLCETAQAMATARQPLAAGKGGN